MSITEVAEPTADQEVADFVDGLRTAADWFEQHPEHRPHHDLRFDLFVRDKQALRDMIAVLGKPVEKDVSGPYFYLRKRFSTRVMLEVNAPREEICRRIVTGKTHVPEKLVPAHDEEQVEWVCDEPLLA